MKSIGESGSTVEKLVLVLIIAICALFHACKQNRVSIEADSGRDLFADITSSHRMFILP